MLESLAKDRFTRWVFALACLFVLIQSSWESTGHHDRARLATVEAIVDYGTWRIEASRYDTIDKISHRGHLYASKPPMMPALMSVAYAAIKQATGRTFLNGEWIVIKLLSILCLGVPYLLFVLGWANLLHTLTNDRWTYRYCLIAGAFGNYVAGYAVIINNHTLASVALFGAVYNAVLLAHKKGHPHNRLLAAGFFAGLAPTFEFPAAAAAALLFLALAHQSGLRKTLTWAAPAACIPLAAHFILNAIATDGSLLPFYMIGDYKYPGSYWLNPQSFDTLNEPKSFYFFNILIGHHGIFSLTPIWLLSAITLARGLRDPKATFATFAWVLAGTLAITLPWFVFKTANYGGGAQGFRWLFWLTPLLLVLLVPAVERLRSGLAWALASAALAFSVFTALFVAQSPWGQSPMHLIFNWLGIIDY